MGNVSTRPTPEQFNTDLVKGRLPAWSCGNIIHILTEPFVLGSLEIFPTTFGFLLIEFSEAVLELDQECTSKEWSDSDIRQSELVAE